jgi:hypothetical protein
MGGRGLRLCGGRIGRRAGVHGTCGATPSQWGVCRVLLTARRKLLMARGLCTDTIPPWRGMVCYKNIYIHSTYSIYEYV